MIAFCKSGYLMSRILKNGEDFFIDCKWGELKFSWLRKEG
jgi:hypothetical protein